MAIISPELTRKLSAGGWNFSQLPLRDDSTSWNDVKVDCGLSNPEISELRNARCMGKFNNIMIIITKF